MRAFPPQVDEGVHCTSHSSLQRQIGSYCRSLSNCLAGSNRANNSCRHYFPQHGGIPERARVLNYSNWWWQRPHNKYLVIATSPTSPPKSLSAPLSSTVILRKLSIVSGIYTADLRFHLVTEACLKRFRHALPALLIKQVSELIRSEVQTQSVSLTEVKNPRDCFVARTISMSRLSTDLITYTLCAWLCKWSN